MLKALRIAVFGYRVRDFLGYEIEVIEHYDNSGWEIYIGDELVAYSPMPIGDPRRGHVINITY